MMSDRIVQMQCPFCEQEIEVLVIIGQIKKIVCDKCGRNIFFDKKGEVFFYGPKRKYTDITTPRKQQLKIYNDNYARRHPERIKKIRERVYDKRKTKSLIEKMTLPKNIRVKHMIPSLNSLEIRKKRERALKNFIPDKNITYEELYKKIMEEL